MGPFRRALRVLPIACLAIAAAIPGRAEAATAADAAVGFRVQTSSGLAPIEFGADPEPALLFELQPATGLRLSESSWRLVLRYQPRAFWRTPNLAETTRPLWLHRADLSSDVQLDPRWTFASSVSGAIGEVDYAAPDLVFVTPVSTVESSPVLTVLSVDANSALTWQTTERTAVSFGVTAGRVGPIPGRTEGDYGSSTSFGGFVEPRWRVSMRDSLRLPLSYRRTWLSLASRYDAVEAQLAWRRELTLVSSLELGAGASAFFRREERAVFVPVTSARWEQTLRASSGRRLVLRAGTSLAGYIDPVLGRVRPVWAAEFTADRDLNGWWSIVTNVNGQTIVAAPLDPPQTETYLSTSVALHRLIRPEMDVAFGIETSARASHLSVRPFEVFDYQAVAFVAFSWATGTAGENQWLW